MWRGKILPSVAVAGGEAHEAVGQVVVVDKGAELAAKVGGAAHGAVPVANNGLGNESSKVVVVLPAHTLGGDGNVGGGHGVVTDPDLGADEVGLLLLGDGGRTVRGGGLGRKVGKVLLGELDELLVGNTTSTNEDHAVSGVVGLDVILEVLALDAQDVLAGSKNRPAEGLALVSGGVQVVEDDLLNLLVNLLALADDDIALALNGRLLELGVLQNVGKDVDGVGDVGVEGLGVVDGALTLLLIRPSGRIF